MKNEPLFNSSYYDSDWNDPRGGRMMKLYYIKDMPLSDDKNMLRCQLYDNGFRVVRENRKWEWWNQTTYEDVDYKNWIKYCKEYLHDESKIIDVEKIYKKVFVYIVTHWPETFYYSEISRHGNGFHFIFYFDTERNEQNWRKCKNISHSIIRQSFIDCGYSDIINLKKGNGWNSVFDDCTDSEFQLIYISKKNPLMNALCSGKIKEYPNLEIIDYIGNKPKKTKYVSNGDEYIINVEKETLDDGVFVDYIDHYQRWSLYDSLRRIFPTTYEDEWDYCAEHIPEQEGHTTEWYKRRSEGSSWDKDYDPNCYIDTDLLKMFGYNLTFTVKTRKKGVTDFINLLGI